MQSQVSMQCLLTRHQEMVLRTPLAVPVRMQRLVKQWMD